MWLGLLVGLWMSMADAHTTEPARLDTDAHAAYLRERLKTLPAKARQQELRRIITEEEMNVRAGIGRLEPHGKAPDLRPSARLAVAYRILAEMTEDVGSDAGLLAELRRAPAPALEQVLLARIRESLSGHVSLARELYYSSVNYVTRAQLILDLLETTADENDNAAYLLHLASTRFLLNLVERDIRHLSRPAGVHAAARFLAQTAARVKDWPRLSGYALQRGSRHAEPLNREAAREIRRVLQARGQKHAHKYFRALPFDDRRRLMTAMLGVLEDVGGNPDLLLELGSTEAIAAMLDAVKGNPDVQHARDHLRLRLNDPYRARVQREPVTTRLSRTCTEALSLLRSVWP